MALVPAGWRCHFQPVVCELTKQGERLLSAVATAQHPSASVALLRKFVASSSKHVALSTLSHLLSPSACKCNSRISSLAFPLYSIIRQETWFSWNGKLVADLIASLYIQGRFDDAEILFSETVVKLRFKERDLCMFYCQLVDSHAKHKSVNGVFHISSKLKQFMLQSSSAYVKQKGYECMVVGFCEIEFPDKAEILIEEMREMGFKISIHELRSLVYGYGRMGFLEDMRRCVAQIEKELGFEVDTVCYNMVLSSLGAHNKLSDMLPWLTKMRDLLSIRTYNSTLNSCPNIIMLLKDVKKVPLSIQEMVDNLSREEADLVLELVKSSVPDEAMELNSSEFKLDLHGMHLSTAYLILLQWFDEMKLRFISGQYATPAQVTVVCGSGKHSSTRGESAVKGLAKEMMIRLKCPLRIDRKNIGCFIAKGKVFKEWLCHVTANCNSLDS